MISDFTGFAKAMNDFIESMERIRTLQGATQEQWDRIAQGILAIADTEGIRDEALPNEQAQAERLTDSISSDPPQGGSGVIPYKFRVDHRFIGDEYR